MLIKTNLWGEQKNKIETAIKRLQLYEPPEGYYMGYSGGKDSTVLYDLAKKAGINFDVHYNHTTVDPPQLISFIKKQDIIIDKPEITMWRLIPKKLMPPTRLVRYCCEILKERGGEGRRVLTGIRWEESNRRSNRQMVESCFKTGKKTFLHPIIDWTEKDIWEYIHREKLYYCSLYDEGYSRLGCIMCPMQGTKGMLRDAERYPKYYQAYLRAFDRMLQERKRRELGTQWRNAQEVMDWWIYSQRGENIADGQTGMFS